MGFNKKKGISAVAVLLVLGVFNAIAFLLPLEHTITFWMGYGFSTLSAFIMLASLVFLFNSDDKEQSFLRLPIVKLAWGYFVIQTLLGIIEITNFFAAYLPILIINCCLTGVYIVAILGSKVVGEAIEKQDAQVAEKIYFINNIQVLLSGIKTADVETASKISMLSEDFKYSDPMSHSMLTELEKQIEAKVITLKSEIADTEKALVNIECISDLLKERNQKCKLLKTVKDAKPQKDNSGAKYVATTLGVFGAIALVVLIALCVIIPKNQYDVAIALYEADLFEEAIVIFENLDGFSNSEIMIDTCKKSIIERDYTMAESYFNKQNYIEAIMVYASLGDFRDSKQKIEQIQNRLTTEDVFYYGSYENKSIAWQVIETKEDKMLLIAKDSVCELPYNDEIKNVDWNDSSLGFWLNNEFMTAFSVEQSSDMIETDVDGNKCKVFLLSDEDISNIENKKILISDKDWWIRTKAEDGTKAMFVSNTGKLSKFGDEVVRSKGVRPCIWLDLK